MRTDVCTEPGRSTTQQRAAGRRRQRRHARGRRRCRSSRRAHAAARSIMRAGVRSPTSTSIGGAGPDQSSGAATCSWAGVTAATASGCGRSRAYGCSPHMRRASASPATTPGRARAMVELLDQALALGGDLGPWRRPARSAPRRRRRAAARRLVASALPDEHEPVGVDRGVHVGAERLHRGSEAGAVEVARRRSAAPRRAASPGPGGRPWPTGTAPAAAARPAARPACGRRSRSGRCRAPSCCERRVLGGRGSVSGGTGSFACSRGAVVRDALRAAVLRAGLLVDGAAGLTRHLRRRVRARLVVRG